MPPKKDRGLQPKKKQDKVVINGKDISGYSYIGLLSLAQEMLNTLDLERKERNEAQLLCDFTRTGWGEARKHLRETKAEILVKGLEHDKRKSELAVRLKESDQERKYEIYNLELFKKDYKTEETQKAKQYKENWEETSLMEFLEKKTALKEEKDTLEESLEQSMEERIAKDEEDLNNLRNELAEITEEQIEERDERLEDMTEIFSFEHDMEVTMINEMYNNLVNKLKLAHKKVFGKVKRFYKETTENDVVLIETLSKEYNTLMQEVKDKQETISTLRDENRHLANPLRKTRRDLRRMELRLNNYQKDMKSFKVVKRKCDDITAQINATEAAIELYESKLAYLDETEQEFDKLIKNADDFAYEQKKLIEKKLEDAFRMLKDFEENNASALADLKESMGPYNFKLASENISKKVDSENKLLNRLQLQVRKHAKAHNDTITVFTKKLNAVGVDSPYNFPPIVSIEYGKGSASVVTGYGKKTI